MNNDQLTALLEEIERPCTKLNLGEFEPTNTIEESWIGKVTHFLSKDYAYLFQKKLEKPCMGKIPKKVIEE